MRQYPTYRNSDLEWLGELPTHWKVERNKYIFREVDDRSETGLEPHLMVNQRYGVVERGEVTDRLASSESLIWYKRCQIGDLVLNKLKAYLGVFFRASIAGLVSPDYSVFRAIGEIDVKYFEYLFRTPLYIHQFAKESKGIVIGFYRLYTPDFYNIYSILPPLEEQKSIAHFLDRKLQKIDDFINKKRRLIELLNEQKTVLIDRAVTKGINPNAVMKDSGINWLEKIPEHWKKMPLKRGLRFYEYGISESIKGEGKYRVLTMGNIQNGKVLVPEKGSLNDVSEGLLLEYGDLLFNRTNSPELVGKVGLFLGDKPDNITFASYLVRLKPNIYANSIYLNFLLNSHSIWSIARQQALVSLHQANLNATKYCQMPVLFPSIEEQQEIVDFLNKEIEKIEYAITKAEREIELIQEYRTTLISDAVTGKIDVRKAIMTES